MEHFDYAVIGAGVTGCWLAYELSKTSASVVVLEKGNDVSSGTSKANSAIVHAGYDPEPGTLMSRLNIRGNSIIRERYRALSIPFLETGSFVLAFDTSEEKVLETLLERGERGGVPGLSIMSGDEARAIEKGISPECTAALFAPTAGIVSPFELALAPMEVAVMNGVVLRRGFNVESVVEKDGGFVLNGTIHAMTVINASGVHADMTARLFGDTSFTITPRRGEYCLLDKGCGELCHILFRTPGKEGKGILATPTVDGNVLMGPTAEDSGDRDDVSTSRAFLEKAAEGAARLSPSLDRRSMITAFSGLRAVPESGDFIIGPSSVPGLWNVAGISSPGLTAAPAIAEYVVEKLREHGHTLPLKDGWKGTRNVLRMRELGMDGKNSVIRENPLYGRIICRCEEITEGEIAASLRSPVPAWDLDGVKRRVRAGMGRCQGGFCTPRVMEIVSRELGIPYGSVTKKGGGSWMVTERRGKR